MDSMTFEEGLTELISYFSTTWNERTPVAYPDVKFNIPNPDPVLKNTWVRMTPKFVAAPQKSIGNPGANKHERSGLIVFQVFCPEGGAGLEAGKYAGQIVNMYLSKTVSGVKYFEPVRRDIGNDGKGWYQINVTANFEFEELA